MNAFVLSPHVQASVTIIRRFIEKHAGATLVVAPNVRDARLIAGHLRAPMLTGDETQAQRRAIWLAWRSSPFLLISTRIGILLPHPKLESVFVVRSSHANHKQSDRNPRFDARKATLIRARIQNVRTYLLDASPRPDELVNADSVSTPIAPWPFSVIDMNKERSAGVHPLLSPTFMDAADSILASGKRVLCVYNRKGVSKRMRCRDCAHVFDCPTCALPLSVHDEGMRCHRCGHQEPLPLSCPACHGNDLLRRGFGNRAVADALQKYFEHKTIGIVQEGSTDASASILLVTKYYLESIFDPFQPSNIGLVAELDADMPLYQPNFRAAENAVISASEWRGVAQAFRADFLLQTETPDLFSRGLSDPIAFMREELKTREAYELPPARRVMTVTKRADNDVQVERVIAAEPPASFRERPDSDIIDTWAES